MASRARIKLLRIITTSNPSPGQASHRLVALRALASNVAAIQALASALLINLQSDELKRAALVAASILIHVGDFSIAAAVSLADTPQCLQTLSDALLSSNKAVAAAAATTLGNIAQWDGLLALQVAFKDSSMLGMVHLMRGIADGEEEDVEAAAAAVAATEKIIQYEPAAGIFRDCCPGAADALLHAKQVLSATRAREGAVQREVARAEVAEIEGRAGREREVEKGRAAARARLLAMAADGGGIVGLGHVDRMWIPAACLGGLMAYGAAHFCISRILQALS